MKPGNKQKFSKSRYLRSSQSSIVMRIEKLGWQFAVEQRRSPHQILLVRIWSIFPWKIFTIFFSSNCFGHKLGSTEPTAIWRIFPRNSFHQIFTIFSRQIVLVTEPTTIWRISTPKNFTNFFPCNYCFGHRQLHNFFRQNILVIDNKRQNPH